MLIEFCLPIYNEEKILEKNTLKLLNFCKEKNFNFDWYINLVINGSSDSSIDIAKKLSEKYKEIKCEEIKKGGKGRAVKKAWRESYSDIFIYMDMDLAVSLNNLPELINEIINNKNDLVWGSRLLKNSVTERNFCRTFISKTYNLLSKILLNHNFSDLQCGFKAINNKTLKSKILPLIENNNWFFDTEIILWSKKYNFKLKEIPVTWKENPFEEKRKSKINPIKDGLIFLKHLFKFRRKIKTHYLK